MTWIETLMRILARLQRRRRRTPPAPRTPPDDLEPPRSGP